MRNFSPLTATKGIGFNLLLIGTTGVGKSTLASLICDMLGDNVSWKTLSSGSIVRSRLSLEEQEIFKSGKLFENERKMRWWMLDHINKLQIDSNINLVLDGFPRTYEQYVFMMSADVPIHAVIHMELDFHIVKDRIISRNRDHIDTVDTAMARTINERKDILEVFQFAQQMQVPSLSVSSDICMLEPKKIAESVIPSIITLFS